MSLTEGGNRRAEEQKTGNNEKSYDTLGTIPRIRPDTATATPEGNMGAYFARSAKEALSFRRRGEAAFRSGRLAESVRAFTLAVDIVRKLSKEDDEKKTPAHDRELSRLLFRRGCARFEQGGQAREAVHDFDQSLELEPAQPLAFLQKGRALLEMQEHAGASRAFLGGLNLAPGNAKLQRLFQRSIRGVRGNSQRYVPGWRGMTGQKPAGGADDGWVPHKLPADTACRQHLVNPYESREDPQVCAALIEANAYIDLDDVLNAERIFWKKTGVSCKRDDLRSRLQLVLTDFKDVLTALFVAYCKRESGLERLAVVRKASNTVVTAAKTCAPPAAADAPKADGCDAGSAEGSGGDPDNSNSDNIDDDHDSDADQSSGSHDGAGGMPRKYGNPSIPAFVDPVSPSRIQRVGKRGVARGNGERAGGGVEVGRYQAEEAHREGECCHDNFVQTRCMTGTQFLDLVHDCTLLEESFLWAEAAEVVRRVCLSGREVKSARSREISIRQQRHIQGSRFANANDDGPAVDSSQGQAGPVLRAGNGSVGRYEREKSDEGLFSTPTRPEDGLCSGGRRHPPHRKRRGKRGTEGHRYEINAQTESDPRGASGRSGRSGRNIPTHRDSTRRGRQNLEGARVGNDEQDAGDARTPRNGVGNPELSIDDGCFLIQRPGSSQKVAPASTIADRREDCTSGVTSAPWEAVTIGGNGKINVDNRNNNENRQQQHDQHNNETPPKVMSKEAEFLRVTEDTEGAKGGPLLFPEFVEALTRLCLARYGPLAPIREIPGGNNNIKRVGGKNGAIDGGAGAGGSAVGSSGRKANQTALPVSLGLALSHHRLRFAFEKHLLPQVVNVSQSETRRVDGEISAVMQRYAPRLQKIFAYFAVGGPSTVPRSTAGPVPNPETATTAQLVASCPVPNAVATPGTITQGAAAVVGKRARRSPAGVSAVRGWGWGGAKRCMSEREFVGMLRSLEMLDERLTLREACRTCISVMGITAIWAGGSPEGSKSNNHSGTASSSVGISTPSAASPIGDDMLLPLTVGDDGMGPDEFARAIYHCGDFKTWDGICPVSQDDVFLLVSNTRRFDAAVPE